MRGWPLRAIPTVAQARASTGSNLAWWSWPWPWCLALGVNTHQSALSRSLATTKFVESPHSEMRLRTRRVTRWRDRKMKLRWTAEAYLDRQKHFSRIMGHRGIWALKSALRPDHTWVDAAVEANHAGRALIAAASWSAIRGECCGDPQLCLGHAPNERWELSMDHTDRFRKWQPRGGLCGIDIKRL